MKRLQPIQTALPPNSTKPNLDPRLVVAINRFGFRLLTELAGGTPTENLLISPASVAAALAMTYNGAAGDTARAMADVLDLGDFSLDEINRAHAALWADLMCADPLADVRGGEFALGQAGHPVPARLHTAQP